jgi:HrpA-like RNA helicase
MTEFPLAPRQSRIIVEAILRYPEVLRETLIAAAFLSTQSPYILPPGEEMDARKAHHSFRDPGGDFVSYLKLFRSYSDSTSKTHFCEKSYLDERAMAEIVNVVVQLEEIVSALNIPILSGGSLDDYLCCVARGMIQFVCVREGREIYRSLTADRISIHPGSVMFKTDPLYIVAGEIVRTTRMYAMSVSPLSKSVLERISPDLLASFGEQRGGKERSGGLGGEKTRKSRDFSNSIRIGGEVFPIKVVKGKKEVELPWEKLSLVKDNLPKENYYKSLKGTIVINEKLPGSGGTKSSAKYTLLSGEKLSLILSLAPALKVEGALDRRWPRKERFNSGENLSALIEHIPLLVSPAPWKGGKELGFICLFTDENGNYWFKCSRGFHTSLNESLASLEVLIDEMGDEVDAEKKHIVNQTYRRLSDYLS